MRDAFTSRADDDYSAADAFELPNRRPTHILNTPALIAHYVFWYSPDHANWPAAVEHFKNCPNDYVARLRDDASDQSLPDPKLVIAAVLNTYLQRFRMRDDADHPIKAPLFTRERTRNNETIRKERTGRGDTDGDPSVAIDRTLVLAGVIKGYTFELTADIFREHFTLSYRVLPMVGHEAGTAVCDTAGTALERARAILNDLVDSGPGKLERIRDSLEVCDVPEESAPRQHGRTGLPAADAQSNYWIKTLYDTFWSEMFASFDQQRPSGDLNLPETFDPSSFADKAWFPADLASVFRNVVIRTMPADAQQATQKEHPEDGENFNMEGDRSYVLRNVPNGVLGHVNERSQLALDGFAGSTKQDPNRLIRARVTEHLNHRSVFFGRLLGFRANNRWVEDLQSGNATLSAMLDGLAIHGSTLGLHTTGRDQYPHKEVRHFVVYGGPSRQQLGRLSRELHAVGEYRLLALRGFRSLEGASREIDRIFDDLAEVDVLLRSGESDAAGDRLSRANNALQDLKQRIPDGGLLHRLLQPEVALNHLRRHVSTLRISRVEGWRPYDEFVTRSVEPHVGYLSSIRAVLDELEEALRGYEARATTVRSEQLTKKIVNVTQNIEAAQELQAAFAKSQDRQGRQIYGLGLIASGGGLLSGAAPIMYEQLTAETLGDREPVEAKALSNIDLAFANLGFFGLALVITGIAVIVWQSFMPSPKKRARGNDGSGVST